MISIRPGVFETNSSSCHVLIKMSELLWEDFKNKRVALIQDDLSCCTHETKFVDILESDNYYTIEDVYDTMCEKIPSLMDFLKENDSEDYPLTFEYVVAETLLHNWSLQFFKEIITSKRKKVFLKLNNPVIVKYKNKSSEKVHDSITFGDFVDLMVFALDLDDFCFYDLNVYQPWGGETEYRNNEGDVIIDKEFEC